MTARLEWGDAELSDFAALQNFCCTPDKVSSTTSPSRKVYPRPPEARAQKLVRELSPAKAPRIHMRIWVGRDESGIAAVAAWRWLDESTVIVHVVALARRLRGRGIVFTDELVDTASAQIAGDAADRGLMEVELTAYIHRDNRPSRAFAKRFGMDELSDADDDGYVVHGVTLAFAEPAE